MRRIFSLLLIFIFPAMLSAQSLFNQGLISITPGTILYVGDSIINDGTIINNGDMQIGGAWINNNQYDAGEGQITFNSDLPQIINHNDQSFSRLTITGGGQKLFLADITIENELDLTDGIMISENDSRIIFNEGSQIIGGSDQSHIKGAVYHKGSGARIFPVGNGTIFLPVEFTNIEGSPSEVGVLLFDPIGTTLQPKPSLEAVSANRYWEVYVVSGSVANSTVILPVRDESIVIDQEKVVVTQSAGTEADFESIGRSNYEGSAENGRVTSQDFVLQPLLAVGTSSDDRTIMVYNGISPNADNLNNYMHITNIELYPDNKVSIFNRWGDKVFEITGYDNQDRVFKGISNVNNDEELVSATYFYIIEPEPDSAKITGYITLKK